MQTNATTTDSLNLTAVLPVDVDGFRASGEDGRYERDTLFALLDGGAEVYRSLNVRAVVSRTYEKSGAPDVLVDIFDMGSCADAYGAYHHDMREGPSAGIGVESEVAGSSLFFWKHRYFVSAVALADSALSRSCVISLAEAIANRIAQNGVRPDIVRLIPERGLIASQVHYFHTWPLLNRYYTFPEDNLLDLADDTEGIVARFRGVGGVDATSALLLVRYPSAERASMARARFVAGYLSARSEDIMRLDEDHWTGVVVREALIVGVFGAATREAVIDLLAAVEGRRGER